MRWNSLHMRKLSSRPRSPTPRIRHLAKCSSRLNTIRMSERFWRRVDAGRPKSQPFGRLISPSWRGAPARSPVLKPTARVSSAAIVQLPTLPPENRRARFPIHLAPYWIRSSLCGSACWCRQAVACGWRFGRSSRLLATSYARRSRLVLTRTLSIAPRFLRGRRPRLRFATSTSRLGRRLNSNASPGLCSTPIQDCGRRL